MSTETGKPLTRDLTDAQAYGRDAARSVTNLTADLRKLADRLDYLAGPLHNGDGFATRIAAEIVNEYVQGAARNGSRLSSLVQDAASADFRHAEDQP